MYYQGYTADLLYRQALTRLLDGAPIQDGRIEPTKELTHVMFELTEPRNRLISMRDINPAFAFVEVLWIMAGGNSVKYLEFWNSRMKDYADNEGHLYGAYGHRLGNHWIWLDGHMNCTFTTEVADSLYTELVDYDGRWQMIDARDSLQAKPNSRQVVLQIWNKDADLPDDAGQERALDIPCNVVSHLLVRDEKLHWLQVMRSNDAVWGFPYNLIQWTFLQEIMAGWLGIAPGPFVLVSDSYHTYKKHWDNIQPILDRYGKFEGTFPEFYTTKYSLPFDEWKRSFQVMIEAAYALTVCPAGDEEALVLSLFNICDLRFMPLMGMLAAEALRIKTHKLSDANSVANSLMSSDPYWKAAWKRWAMARESGVII